MAYIDTKGFIRGKMGGKNYSVRNGKQYVREISQRKDKTMSEAQQLNNLRFKTVIKILNDIAPIHMALSIKPKKTWRTDLNKYLFKNVILKDQTKIIIHLDQLFFGNGNPAFPNSTKCTTEFENTIMVKCDPENKLSVLRPHDYKIGGIILYSTKDKTWDLCTTPILSSDNQAIFPIKSSQQGHNLHIWTFYERITDNTDKPSADHYTIARYCGLIKK